MQHRFAAVLLAAGLAFSAACTGGAAASSRPTDPAAPARGTAPASAARRVTIRSRDSMKFEPASIAVTAGQPVEVTLENTGSLVHDLSLAEGVSQPIKIEAVGGASATATFTVDRPGTYTFLCSVPGHEAAGMKGTITAR